MLPWHGIISSTEAVLVASLEIRDKSLVGCELSRQYSFWVDLADHISLYGNEITVRYAVKSTLCTAVLCTVLVLETFSLRTTNYC